MRLIVYILTSAVLYSQTSKMTVCNISRISGAEKKNCQVFESEVTKIQKYFCFMKLQICHLTPTDCPRVSLNFTL